MSSRVGIPEDDPYYTATPCTGEQAPIGDVYPMWLAQREPPAADPPTDPKRAAAREAILKAQEEWRKERERERKKGAKITPL